VDLTLLVLNVEGELALQHVVNLAWIVPMHHRWTAIGRHPQFDGEQRAVCLGVGGHNGDLLGAECQTFMTVMIDR
jgi:hypothetical protein